MKRLLLIIPMLFISFTYGCENKNDAEVSVKNYLNNYINLENNVLEQLDEYVELEELSNNGKDNYKEALINQYQNLQYNIERVEYDSEKANVTVIIKVLDLHKVSNNATKYLEDNPNDFKDETGNYDKALFLEYKMEEMKNATDIVEYTIIFDVIKSDGSWTVEQPSNTVLEKIHGIYDYDKK